METGIKLKIRRIFRSSFGSCRSTKNITEVIDPPVQKTQHRQLMQLFSPKPPHHPFPSICRPGSEHFLLPRTKISDRCSLLDSSDLQMVGRKCPPTSPVLPLNDNNCHRQATIRSKKKKKKKIRAKTMELALNYKGIFSSDEDEDDDKTTFFSSSKSLSSDSSKFNGRTADGTETGVMARAAPFPVLQGKVKDSFAVVKHSRDPYDDFRTSMVEMIIQRQIFGARDLESLLSCFMSLNSEHHHGTILNVFTEICQVLF